MPSLNAKLERVFICVNDVCDSRCRLCDYWASGSGEMLSPDFIERVVVPLVKRHNVKSTCVTGGEPTLHPRLAEIMQMLAATRSIVTLVTSCSRLDDHFEDIVPSIGAYMLSFDAADRETYRRIRGIDLFEQVVTWPGRIKRYGRPAVIALSCVIQKQKRSADRRNLSARA